LGFGLVALANSWLLFNPRRMFASIQASALIGAVKVCLGMADPAVILAVRRRFDALVSLG
jgi:hypothetical protein